MGKVIIASGPVIVKDDKFLLDISGDDEFWKFCGGQVKEGEGLKEAAMRRAKEELGIDVIIKGDEPFIMYVPKPGDEKTDVILVHWLADYKDEIVPGKMVKEWAWLNLDDLTDSKLAPNVVPALRHFGYLE